MTPPAPFAHSVAVVIGIDHYGNGIPELRTAANDARRMGELLQTQHGYELIALLDGDATLTNITTLLTTTLPARIGSDDRVLFYFAGHGVARDGDEGPNGYLLPVDAKRGDDTTYLDMPLVHDALLKLTCRHMLVILDSCFSGAFRWSGTRSFEEDVTVVHQEKYDRFVHDAAWQVITSASQDQRAIDQLTSGALGSRDETGEHSPFALALFDGIAGKSDLIPKGEGDGLVTATELYLYLDDTLESAAKAVGKSQTPRLWPLSKHDKGEYVFFVPGRDLTLPPAPPLTFDNNPWRGLTSYEASDAALFFGRDDEIAALRARIDAAPLTVVLGASGTGKSSLVKAGVVPTLPAAGWLTLPIMRPGTSPLVALGQALSTSDAATVAATDAAITARVKTLVDANAGKKILLVIDQFEELITLVRSTAERDQTLALLASLITTFPDALRVVVTIRTDFEPNFDRAAFGDRWRDGRYVVPPMSRDNLRAVIEKPATLRVLYFDPSNLVDTLLDEVVATPGALPLLSFALSEMYIAYVKRQSSDRAITRADYEALGGVVGALRARAESEFAALDEASQGTLRRVMLRLVTSDGGALARRRVSDEELDFADDGERTRAADVVQRLIAARLLVRGKEPDGGAFVEPAHDALARGWGRLVQWVREESEAAFPLAQQQRMARAALDWDAATGPAKDGLLWSDAPRALQLAPLVARHAPWLNRRELAFAKRSVRGRRVAKLIAAAVVVAIAAGGAAATVAGLRASARAEQVRIGSIVRTAASMISEDPLIASQLLGSIDSTMVTKADNGTWLAMLGAANDVQRGPQVVATFDAPDEVYAAALSPDMKTVATSAADNAVRIWEVDRAGSGTPPALAAAGKGRVTSLAYSPNSLLLATGDVDGTVSIYPTNRVSPVAVMKGDSAGVLRMTFSADSRLLLATYADGVSRVLHADRSAASVIIRSAKVTSTLVEIGNGSSKSLLTPGPVLIAEAEFADSARQVITAMSDSTVQFWPSSGARKPTRTVTLPGREGVTRIAVSPDGRRVAIGGEDGTVMVIDVARTGSGKAVRIHAQTGAITALDWSRDARQLVSAATDESVMISNPATGQPLARRRRFGTQMLSAKFSPDGQSVLATSTFDFQAFVWDSIGDLVLLPGHTNLLVAAEFSHDSRHVLTAAADGSVRLWALPTAAFYRGVPLEREHPEGGQATAAAFAPDSKSVIIGNADGTVFRYWLDGRHSADTISTKFGTWRALAITPDGALLRGLSVEGTRNTWALDRPATHVSTPNPDDEFFLKAGFTSDARHVYSVSDHGEAVFWDVGAATPPFRIRMLPADSLCAGMDVVERCLDPSSGCAAQARDGSLAAACLRDGTLAVYRPPTALPLRKFKTDSHAAGAAFSHDAAQIAIGYDTGLIRVFRLDVPNDTGRSLAGHRKRVSQLEFSPDNTQLLSTSQDGTMRIWNTLRGQTVVTVRPKGLVIQSARFTPDGKRVLTLGAQETDARLWNSDGSGGFVSFPAVRGEITDVYPSRDGRWLLAATDSLTARLYALDAERALQPLRTSRICLGVGDRQRYLSESATTAARNNAACVSQRTAQ